MSSDEGIALTEKVIDFMGKNAHPKERLGMLIDRVGWEEFLDAIGLTP